MIALNLAGITFLEQEVVRHFLADRIHLEQKCFVKLEGNESSTYDADFSVNVNIGEDDNITTHRIGWIPRTSTVSKYMNQAYMKKDNERYARECERLRLLEILRGNIHTDITINLVDPYGIINNILFIEGEKFFNEGSNNMDRKLASVSCRFEYPNP